MISTVLKSGEKIDDPSKNVSLCGKNDNPAISSGTLKKPTQLSVISI